MIKYEDIIKQIRILENKKQKNDARLASLTQENSDINAKLKVLNQKKELFEKMNNELSELLDIAKKPMGAKSPIELASTE